jgi:cell division protein FtsQ
MNNREILLMVKRLAWIGFFFLIAVAIISAVEAKKGRTAADIFIKIATLPDGDSLINQQDVKVTIERSFGYNLLGIPVREIDVARVERVLENDPFILNADVFLDAKNQIHIEIEQREPILRIIDKNGLNYYLDKDGMKMPLSKHFTARVLVATGNIPPFDLDFLQKKKHILKDLFELTNIILKDDFLEPMIQQIYVNNSKEYELSPLIGDQKILLGKMNNIENKIFYLKTFYKEAIPYKGWQKYKTINLKIKGQVVAGRR